MLWRLIYKSVMQDPKKQEEFYVRLKAQLEEQTSWPSVYLYKFIVPSEPEKIEAIKAIFDSYNAAISTRASSKGTFTSVSVKVHMQNPDAVIEKYLEVSIIKGVISL